MNLRTQRNLLAVSTIVLLAVIGVLAGTGGLWAAAGGDGKPSEFAAATVEPTTESQSGAGDLAGAAGTQPGTISFGNALLIFFGAGIFGGIIGWILRGQGI